MTTLVENSEQQRIFFSTIRDTLSWLKVGDMFIYHGMHMQFIGWDTQIRIKTLVCPFQEKHYTAYIKPDKFVRSLVTGNFTFLRRGNDPILQN